MKITRVAAAASIVLGMLVAPQVASASSTSRATATHAGPGAKSHKRHKTAKRGKSQAAKDQAAKDQAAKDQAAKDTLPKDSKK